MSTSAATKGRSTCCSTWPAARRSTCRGISVLALAEQYLGFIETVREKRIEIAADYLVMAAWLAYLKSRLMVPQAPSDDEPSGRDDGGAAAVPAEAARSDAQGGQPADEPAAAWPPGLCARACPSRSRSSGATSGKPALYDLLKAYATQRERGVPQDYQLFERTVWSLQEAREILQRLIGDSMDWVPLRRPISPNTWPSPEQRVTAMASTFASSLELVRQGQVELRQTLAFGPLFVRRRPRTAEPKDAN